MQSFNTAKDIPNFNIRNNLLQNEILFDNFNLFLENTIPNLFNNMPFQQQFFQRFQQEQHILHRL